MRPIELTEKRIASIYELHKDWKKKMRSKYSVGNKKERSGIIGGQKTKVNAFKGSFHTG